jgi:hypothetical protein
MKWAEMLRALDGRSADAIKKRLHGVMSHRTQKKWHVLQDSLEILEEIRKVQLPSQTGDHPPSSHQRSFQWLTALGKSDACLNVDGRLADKTNFFESDSLHFQWF